jgi:anion-transporting  ArsA/GET3 family ATPase
MQVWSLKRSLSEVMKRLEKQTGELSKIEEVVQTAHHQRTQMLNELTNTRRDHGNEIADLNRLIRNLKNRTSVTIAGGEVFGEYEQVKAVQSLILESEKLRAFKEQAHMRLLDMLEGDDGQAWKEAKNFLAYNNLATSLDSYNSEDLS